MSMENIIKEKTEEIVLKYKLAFEARGGEFNSLHESLLRQGISYGVSFAAIALASVPVDITLTTIDKDKDEKNSPLLKSTVTINNDGSVISESDCSYKKSKLNSCFSYSDPLFLCPKCMKGYIRKNKSIISTSYPPQYQYECDECGHILYGKGECNV